MIKFVSDLQQIGGILGVSGFLTNKTHRHDITELLLKAALGTINPPFYCVNQSLRKCILTNVVIKHFLVRLYYIEFKYVVHVELPVYLCILFK